MSPFGEEKIEHTLYCNPCDEGCKRRIVLSDVSVSVCIKTKCEFFSPEGCYCKKYVEENKKRHKPIPFKFYKGLTTPADHGFYGKKRLDRKGFV